MRFLRSIAETKKECRARRATGKTLGLVPTMGALHEGHLSLIRAAQAKCGTVIVSIFVNPLQFGPTEDLARYPSDLEKDRRLLEQQGVDLLFAPSVEEMYPAGSSTFVEVADVGNRLDGASRIGHFRGVATVVTKLFHITAPDWAFFGQKDAAQSAVLRKMVRDLDFDLQIEILPTVRESDGLALSSRNQYLSKEERRRAVILSKALHAVQERAQAGEVNAHELLLTGMQILSAEPDVRLDYFSIVDPDTLETLPDVRSGGLVAIAAFVGATRLIDNLLLKP